MVPDNLNQRFSWALSILNLQPSEKVLEIGCGVGILAERMCRQLPGGQLVAIDQSLPMIEKAMKRNKWFVAYERAEFMHCKLADFTPGPYRFNEVVAFNVNVFWNNPAKELEVIEHCLLPEGRLYIFYQAPFDITRSAANPLLEKLTKHNFLVEKLVFKKMIPASAFCLITRPALYCNPGV